MSEKQHPYLLRQRNRSLSTHRNNLQPSTDNDSSTITNTASPTTPSRSRHISLSPVNTHPRTPIGHSRRTLFHSATSSRRASNERRRDDLTDSESDIDASLDMASTSNSLLPTPFNGQPNDDVYEFLKNYELWTVFRRMNAESILAALPLLLKGNASLWYNTQSREV